MNRLGMLPYGAVIAGIALLLARETIEAAVYLYQKHSSGAAALGTIGWAIATFGPLALSMWFWRLGRRLEAQWLIHLLFIPCALAIHQAGASLLFFAAGVPDGDSIEGWSLLAGSGFLAFLLLVHIIALAALGVARISRRVNR